jgi:hypothetical protein
MTDKEFVIYNGVRVIASWPARIEDAQRCATVAINGKEYGRVPYGEEGEGWTSDRPCHDCAVIRGQFHVPGCDVERCPACGDQVFSCDCDYGDDEK